MGVLMDTREGPTHQICNFLWADNLSHKDAPQADEGLD